MQIRGNKSQIQYYCVLSDDHAECSVFPTIRMGRRERLRGRGRGQKRKKSREVGNRREKMMGELKGNQVLFFYFYMKNAQCFLVLKYCQTSASPATPGKPDGKQTLSARQQSITPSHSSGPNRVTHRLSLQPKQNFLSHPFLKN